MDADFYYDHNVTKPEVEWLSYAGAAGRGACVNISETPTAKRSNKQKIAAVFINSS